MQISSKTMRCKNIYLSFPFKQRVEIPARAKHRNEIATLELQGVATLIPRAFQLAQNIAKKGKRTQSRSMVMDV
jgi:hypothetical protein